MKRRYSILLALLLIPIVVLALYLAFLWITYIDETVIVGEKYGFSIGSSKDETYEDVLLQQKSFPDLHIYIISGSRAGDYFEVSPNSISLEELKDYEDWTLLYDGEGEYFNVLKLKFDNTKLTRIYRHRKYFELP